MTRCVPFSPGRRRALGIATAVGALGLLATPHVRAAASDALPRAIAAQLAGQAVVRAQFTQTRQLAALKRPVVSSGLMVYSRENGILWQIEKPVALAYALVGDKVLETGADGVTRERQVPALTQVTRVMRALLAADIDSLGRVFDVTATGEASRWQLRLVPRQAQLAQVIAAVELTGGRYIESIRIEEAAGDSTLMAFRGSQVDTVLTPAERRLLGLERN